MTDLAPDIAEPPAAAQGGALSVSDARALDAQGYTVLRQAIPADWIAPLCERFEDAIVPHDQWPVPRDADLRHAMLNDDDLTRRACNLPVFLAAAEHVLKLPFYLIHVQGRDPIHGGGDKAFHRDWEITPSGRAEVVSVLAFLDPFGPENGATCVIPGTHRGQATGGEIVVQGAPGDALVFNGAVEHRSTENVSGAKRRTLQFCFQLEEMRSGKPLY